MAANLRLLNSIYQYLNSVQDSAADKEGLQVALECLSTSFPGILDAENQVSLSLDRIFEAGLAAGPATAAAPAIDTKAAEAFKNSGNHALQKGDFQEAVALYSKAIEANPNSAVYFTNRAVAYASLKNWQAALEDATKATTADAGYTKAFYRQGQALFALNRTADAVEAFEKALELARTKEPAMASTIQQQLQTARDKLRAPAAAAAASSPFGGAGGPGGLDFGKILSDPNMQGMINSVLQNPQALSGILGMMGGGAGGSPFGAPPAPAPTATPAPAAAGAAGAGAAPSNPMLQGLLNHPSVRALQSDPELAPIIADIQANGMPAIMKHLSNPNPKLQAVISEMMKSLGGGMGM